MTTCCPCDGLLFPLEPAIAAGLDVLPRQAMGFAEYRQALLGSVRQYVPLTDWRARNGDDLGLMLVEWWAYVLDVVGFYDQQIAQASYLRTATDPAAVHRLTGLIGYRPRPAVGAEALLAAIADAGPDVLVPALTAFRSEAIGSEPPQVFESGAAFTISPRRNRWRLAPLRPSGADGTSTLLFDIASLRLVKDARAVIRHGSTTSITQVTGIAPVKALDGVTYAQVSASPPVAIPAGTALSGVSVRMPTASAGLSRLAETPIATNMLLMDAIYPQIGAGQDVLLVAGTVAEFHTIESVAVVPAEPPASSETPPPQIPTLLVTQLTFATDLDSFAFVAGSVVVHFQLVDGGKLVRAASTRLQRSDFNPTATLAGPADPLDTPAAGPLLVQDRDRQGAVLDGTVSVTEDGAATLAPSTDTTPFERPMVAPVEIFGNVFGVTRGETVAHEVLGSGDATQALPSFKLKKKPLTYLPSTTTSSGRKSTLEIRVNGILWQEVESFYGTEPTQEVYIVRQDADQNSTVTFWRLPSGINNITARYRFGAGAVKPPAGGLQQIIRPVKGLARVINPVAAGGGADADQPKDIKRNGPASALTLGRAVSLADFDALARSFGGVVNVSAGWAWDTRRQRAVVKLSYIDDGGDIADSLRSFLVGQADPNVPVVAAEATAVPKRLIVDVVPDERFEAADVEAALIEALSNPDTGPLAHANIPIGGPLFRSALLAVVMKVPGVALVNDVTVDGVSVPVALTAGEGSYLDFLPFTNS
jgi:hypothetical protein